MKTFIIFAAGVLAGLLLAVILYGSQAQAATAPTSGLQVVDYIGQVHGNQITKVYDSDANVVCYVMANGGSFYNYGGISCLKND